MRLLAAALVAGLGTGVLMFEKLVHREPALYVLDSLHRAMFNDSPPLHPSRDVFLFAAKGETASFQIVIYGGASGLEKIDAVADGNFSLKLYREHYIAISNPSKYGVGGARAGVYPDALIPFVNPFTGERLSGPMDVEPWRNQVIYAEMAVPENAAVGVYHSSVTVGALGQIPITLTVWDFAIPKKPSLRTAFNDYDSERLIGPANYYGYRQNSPEHLSVAVAMDEDLLANRIVPEIPLLSYFKVQNDGHIAHSAEQDRRLLAMLNRPERSDLKLYLAEHAPFNDPLGADRQRTIVYLRDAYDWFAKYGLLEKVWLRVQDEPENAADFRKTRAFAELIHEANPKFKVAITGSMDHAGFDEQLYGHLDTFIMSFDMFDPRKAAREEARGEQFWSYTGEVETPENPSPYWQIEFPLLDFRVAPWINFRYGLRGLLYWTTAKWDEIHKRGHSPWSDACSVSEHGSCYNGDGMLVYPGDEVHYVIPAGAYGDASTKPVYGPIPSLRLKALRDGMQDYELLALAAKKNPRGAMEAAIAVGCNGNPEPGDTYKSCFHSWNTDPDELFKMRSRLAEIITSPQ